MATFKDLGDDIEVVAVMSNRNWAVKHGDRRLGGRKGLMKIRRSKTADG
jgi:hypothetical protein